LQGGDRGRGRVGDGADVGGAQGARLDQDQEAAEGEQRGGEDVPRRAVVDEVEGAVELRARARVSTPCGVLALAGMAQAVVEGEHEREKGLQRSVHGGSRGYGAAHHCRGRAALDVLHDAVVEAKAPAHGEQEHRQQRTDSLDAPRATPDGCAGLGPQLLAGRPALAMAQRNGDVSPRRLRLRAAEGPRFDGDDGEPGQQQQCGDGVQRLVEGERVVDGRRGAQVAGREDEAAGRGQQERRQMQQLRGARKPGTRTRGR
jgi:hypothetical protein